MVGKEKQFSQRQWQPVLTFAKRRNVEAIKASCLKKTKNKQTNKKMAVEIFQVKRLTWQPSNNINPKLDAVLKKI